MSKEFSELLATSRELYEAMNRFDAYTAKRLGVHPSDIRCLNALLDGALTAGQIADRLGLTTGSVTALVNRLMKVGYVVRTENEHDRRRKEISLHPDFREKAEKIYNSLGAHIGAQFEDCTVQQISLSTASLRRIMDGFSVDRFADRDS